MGDYFGNGDLQNRESEKNPNQAPKPGSEPSSVTGQGQSPAAGSEPSPLSSQGQSPAAGSAQSPVSGQGLSSAWGSERGSGRGPGQGSGRSRDWSRDRGRSLEQEQQGFPFGKELKRRTTRRAKFRDYREPGFYMITITARKETPPFCRIFNSAAQDSNRGNSAASDSDRGNSAYSGEGHVDSGSEGVVPEIELTPLGAIIDGKIVAMPQFTPQLEIVRYVVMPDHLHVLLQIKSRLERHLGKVIGGFMGGCTAAARKASLIPDDASLFNEKFHDRVVSRVGQVGCLKKYIADNPRRLLIKRRHPDLFRRYLHLRIGDREYAAYGNIFLLKHSDLLPVRIHRRWSPSEFSEYEEKCTAEINNGAVPVSPFIHPAEKAIRDYALDAGRGVIILRDQGFESRFKPQGRYFDLCVEGRLLLLAPWPENTGRKSAAGSREFHSMNDMAAAIASMPAGIRMAIVGSCLK